MKIADQNMRDTSYLVIGMETTGLDPDDDRIVELAAVALLPGSGSFATRTHRLLDTLIDPQRPMAGGRFHGLSSDDIAGAPRFAQIWPALAAAATGRVLAFYDARFGFGFLESEAWLAGRALTAPYLDIRRLPRAGDFGPADWPLWRAGQRYGIARAGETRIAGEDALLAAGVLAGHLDTLAERGITTFAELAARSVADDYVRSFALTPRLVGGDRPMSVAQKPREAEAARRVG